MNKQQAELTARVARRIGLGAPLAIENKKGWRVLYRHGPDYIREFEPVTKPADRARVWDWVESEGLTVTLKLIRGVYYCTICPALARPCSASRVTALLMAIDALPDETIEDKSTCGNCGFWEVQKGLLDVGQCTRETRFYDEKTSAQSCKHWKDSA